jgi:omega-amidase
MKAGIAQIQCTPGDAPANCALIAEYAARARAAGCDLVIFPEMTDTGYDPSLIRQSASPWTGLPFQVASKAAAHEQLHIVCGLSEREGDQVYNSIAVLGPNGELTAKYRKMHLFNPPPVKEGECIAPGNSPVVIDIGGFKCGLMICYDLRFPELARTLALKGAEALLIASAWPFPRVEHWQVLLKARAIENQAYVIAANRVGSEGGMTFCGSSTVIDPYGVIVGSGVADRSQLIVGDLDRDMLNWVRGRMPVFTDRRPDLYQA